jgi:hypothetical protein
MLAGPRAEPVPRATRGLVTSREAPRVVSRRSPITGGCMPDRATDEPDAELIAVNGVDGTTGRYLLSDVTAAQIADIALGRREDAEEAREIGLRRDRMRRTRAAVKAGVDPTNLAETGWGVIFARDADPAIREALAPLLAHRRALAAAKREHYYRELAGADGYAPGETKNRFLARHGVGPGPADPERMPYYLLIVGDPESIPFRFQHLLDTAHAVGRIHFATPDEYGRYAQSVVAAETRPPSLPRRLTLVGVRNRGDVATQLSADKLVAPLAATLGQSPKPGWEIRAVVGEAATKANLAALLGGTETSALLFTASHGVGFPNGDPRQLAHQGALLCQDWPGPLQHAGPISPDHYLAAEDIGDRARVAGVISFHFACYGAGTPRADEFAHLAPGRDPAIAPHAFVARLPQRLLGHPRGGALAVIGHVDRAWPASFVWKRAGPQTQVFESTLRRLMDGHPVGSAMEFFSDRYTQIASDLSVELQEIVQHEASPDERALADLWTANNDARSYAIVGDPATRVRPA